MTTTDTPSGKALLLLPRLRVQNANAIASPMTWGFPSITAFIGLMRAMERKLAGTAGLEFHGVGVICHGFEAQATNAGYTRSFHLTRNPVGQDGGTAGIVEEGRVHLDISLLFDVDLNLAQSDDAQRQQLADAIGELVAGMRVAGGSVMPALPSLVRRPTRPRLMLVSDDEVQRQKDFGRLCRRLLPGFALVSRDDLLQENSARLKDADPNATALDAWLDLSRLNYRATRTERTDAKTGATSEAVEWALERRKGWTVPIAVGYASLSELYAPGTVANARDAATRFRFVESIYSMGQWISPHRLRNANELLWYEHFDDAAGLYRCRNDFRPPVSPSSSAIQAHND